MPARLLSLLAPSLCGVCGRPTTPEAAACEACTTAIAADPPQRFIVPGADAAWAATAYEGTARRLVTALKFGKRLALAKVAARAIAAGMPKLDREALMVPVPPDPLRHRWRGFDPAGAIADELAGILGISLSHCLVRAHSRRQVGRSRDARLIGPAVRVTAAVPPRVLLVDDVATTGATLATCATALRFGGAEQVLALAFARA